MTRYIGLDVHKTFIEVCILDHKGKITYRGRVACNREAMKVFAESHLKKRDQVALEATTNTWPVVEFFRPFVSKIVVGNPLKTKAIAEAKIKTDKVDAEILAQLLRCEFLPEVWQPDSNTQILRGLITHRTGLTTRRTRHKNRIKCVLGRLLIHPPCKVLWTKAGMKWLKSVELPASDRFVVDSELRQLDSCEQEIAAIDSQLLSFAADEPQVRLLMTLPGVSYVVAIGLLAAFGDIGRFRDGNHAASYLGLVPSTHQSGNHCYHGRITKAGNSQARWLLTQSCQHVARHPGPLGAFFRRLAKRKNRQVAIIAVARKLVTIAYLMLKNNEPYRYAKPELMAEKLTMLDRAKSDAARNKRSKSKASLKSHARSGLAAVYSHAGLPTVKNPGDLSPGEQKMLKNRKLVGFAKGLYSPAKAKAESKPARKERPTR